MFIANGKKITGIFTGPGGTQYPLMWVQSATQEQLAALGIAEHPDPVYPDHRYYTYTEDDAGTVTVFPRPVDSVQSGAISRINDEAGHRVRAVFPEYKQTNCIDGTYGPSAQTWCEAMRDYKAAVIAASNNACDAILAAQTVEAVAAAEAAVSWPPEVTP